LLALPLAVVTIKDNERTVAYTMNFDAIFDRKC